MAEPRHAALDASLLPGFCAVATGPAGGEVLDGTFPGTVRAGLRLSAARLQPTAALPGASTCCTGCPDRRRSTSPGRSSPAFADRRSPPDRAAAVHRGDPGRRDEARLQRRVGRAVGGGRWSNGRSRGSTRNLPTIADRGGPRDRGPLRGRVRRRSTSACVIRICSARSSRGAATSRRCTTGRSSERSTPCSPPTTRRCSSVRSSAVLARRRHCASSSRAARRTATGSAQPRRSRSPPSCGTSGCRSTLRLFPIAKGEWREQLDAGLAGRSTAEGVESGRMLGNVLTAIVTPFREDGAVDFDAFQRLARHLVDERLRRRSSSPARRVRARRSRDGERLDLIRAALEAVGDERDRRRRDRARTRPRTRCT